MVYKLVRTDCNEPCKIPLAVGTHLIGRGKFLECEDKRISRNHGELIVEEHRVLIKALHQNPCFYMKKDTDKIEVLKQDSTTELSNGDRFGLLPQSYWYEVLHCSIDITPQPAVPPPVINSERVFHSVAEKVNEEQNVTNSGNDTNTESMTINYNLSGSNDQIARDESQSLIPLAPVIDPEQIEQNENEKQEDNTKNDSMMSNSGSIEDNDNDVKPESPSLLPANTTPETDSYDTNIPSNLEADSSSTHDKVKIKTEPDTSTNEDEIKSPVKRRASQDEGIDSKRIKKEEDNSNDLDAQPGPSNDQGNAAAPDSSGNKPPSPANPAAPPGRERCIYGANCYRRNPQHKTEFSHPSDSDWGSGARGVCPYGAACNKRDPRHWNTHDHPPGTCPPDVRNRPQGKPAKPKKVNSDSSEDDLDDLIVTGKRTRKAVARDDQRVSDDDDDEQDPYGTDDSDEWQPDSEDKLLLK